MENLYFINCCTSVIDDDNYFGIQYEPISPLSLGNIYKVVTNNKTLCGTYTKVEIPTGSTIYIDVNSVTDFGSDCLECLTENPCVSPTPTPLPNQPNTVNECNVITIFPMNIECVTSNPSTPTSSDGEMSVSITGGTPPYTIIWSNGNIAPAIQNLTVGSYTATVIDYYGDFSATTTCVLTSEYDCEFSATVENFVIQPSPSVTPTLTATPTLTPTPTRTPNITPSNTPTPTPTPSVDSCQSWGFKFNPDSYPSPDLTIKAWVNDCNDNTIAIHNLTPSPLDPNCFCFSTNIFPPQNSIVNAVWGNGYVPPPIYGINYVIVPSVNCCL